MNKISNNGFTIVELIVVILLVGVLSVFIAPRFFNTDVFVERRTKDELISALRYTQQLAMNRGENHRLQIIANSYTYRRDNGGAWPVIRNPDGNQGANNFPDRITMTPVDITFNQMGQPDPNNTIIISIGAAESITIEQDTGYAH